ncbi:15-O-acetyltransferase Tri3-domain-containing protein [Rhexocercosporidium sp. MPI-PUGE-AT-0058]|nr:15-O-acetyltransferase Tri3-domain-containing protein [Rhexocercosporidium sp. MPI-PUGE-AT-0058]
MVSDTISSPLNPSSCAWEQSSQDSSLWQRRALSNECMWLPRPKDLHELFICTSITINSPIPRPTLDSAATRAWQILRFQVPELAAHAACSKDGAEDRVVYMQYQTPHSQAEVDAWIDRTRHSEAGRDLHDFGSLRAKVLVKKHKHVSDKAFILLYSQARGDSRDLVENVQIMLYVDHQVMDGTGIKIVLGKYLSLLASTINKPGEILHGEIKWEESYKNLSIPWIQHMNEDQVISGPKYEQTVAWNRDIILGKMKTNPGLTLSHTTNPVTQETHFITLSPTQTSTILQAIKDVLGPSSNITHLCHAAMVLALLRASSISTSASATQTLYSPCWLNGRRYLSPTPPCPSPKTDYIPICLSFAPIIFTDLDELVLSSTATRCEMRDKLLKACRMSTEQYINIREKKSMLPETVNLFEDIARMMLQSNTNNPTNLADPKPNPQNYHTSHKPPQTAEPFFLSDGLIEQYILHTYPSSQSTSASTSPSPSPPTLRVKTVHFAAHAEQNLIVRMSSWRGSTTISGEWRGCDYEDGVIVRFLEDVVGIMGVLVENDGWIGRDL